MLGILDAEHAEDAPDAANWVIVPVACAVPGRADGEPGLSGGLVVRLTPGSRTAAIYGRGTIEEQHFCSFEVSPAYAERFERGGLRIAGMGPAGEIRVVELPGHPFFIATLYQPQRSSKPGAPNPLVTAFLHAAASVEQSN